MMKTSDPQLDAIRFLSLKEVLAISLFSTSTLYREMNAKRFPRQYSISGNKVGWKYSEVAAWAHARERVVTKVSRQDEEELV